MTRRPITVVIDVDERDMNYDEDDAKKVGTAASEAVTRYVNAGGELDTFAIEVEPIQLDSWTGIRLTLTGFDRDSSRTPAGAV